MNPNNFKRRSQITLLRHGLAITVGMFVSLASSYAALIRWDISGPVTHMYDSPSNLLGNLEVGDPLASSFVYDTAHWSVTGYSPDIQTYVSTTAQISALIDEVSYNFTRLEMTVSENATWSFYDATQGVADGIELRAIDHNGFNRFDATFLWPVHTLSRFDVTAPPLQPSLVQIYWLPENAHIEPAAAFSLVHFGDLAPPPPPPPVISPVPEASTFGLLGTTLLVGLIAKRWIRLGRPVQSGAEIP